MIVVTKLLEENVLQYEIDVLTNMILFAQQGSIHPRFLNLTQIRETADLISRTISEATFPASTDENAILELVKISDVTILLYNFRLIYHIVLPLIDFNTNQLFKASPLPGLQSTDNKSNNFAYIWPSSQYFAVSTSKNTYINMDSKALGHCKKAKQKLQMPGDGTGPNPQRTCGLRGTIGRQYPNSELFPVRCKNYRVGHLLGALK